MVKIMLFLEMRMTHHPLQSMAEHIRNMKSIHIEEMPDAACSSSESNFRRLESNDIE